MRYVLRVRGYQILDHTYVDITVVDESKPTNDPKYECWMTTVAYDDPLEPNPKRWARLLLRKLAHDA